MELLTRLWLAGETARVIAEELGGGVTRNAVIGKAHRLGLTGKQGSKRAALKRARASRLGGNDQKLEPKPKPKNRAR
jgi:GcrA cell cycle regulator